MGDQEPSGRETCGNHMYSEQHAHKLAPFLEIHVGRKTGVCRRQKHLFILIYLSLLVKRKTGFAFILSHRKTIKTFTKLRYKAGNASAVPPIRHRAARRRLPGADENGTAGSLASLPGSPRGVKKKQKKRIPNHSSNNRPADRVNAAIVRPLAG